MGTLIIDGQARTDVWQHLDDTAPYPKGSFTVSLARFGRERRDVLTLAKQPGNRFGVRLELDQDPLALAPCPARLALVIIRIPDPADGRGFSIAARLREHLNYRGELRATGNVAPDQLDFLVRCGVNAFELPDRAGVPVLLSRYEHHYQPGGPWDRSHKALTATRQAMKTPPVAEDARPGTGSV